MGTREDGLSGVEFSQEFFDGLIVSRLSQVVESDCQGAGSHVRGKVGLGIEDLSEQSAGIVGSSDMFAKELCHAGFGAISDHLDGIDEMLSFRAQTSKAVLFRQ